MFVNRKRHLKKCIKELESIFKWMGIEPFQDIFGDRMTAFIRHLGFNLVAKTCDLARGLFKQKRVSFSRASLLFPMPEVCLVHTQGIAFRSPAESTWEKNLEGYIPVIP